ncbi:MAG: S8 family serine peptidase [Methanosarcinales archaeon]|nr:S8 family serine peptidase [Methanosarcinales archaeon]
MLNYKIKLLLILMLIGIFIISTSAADNHLNQSNVEKKITIFEEEKKYPKIESNLLQKDSNIFRAQFQNDDLIKIVFILKSNNESYIQLLEENGAIIEAVCKNHAQARIPASKLPEISELPFVTYVRSPLIPYKDVVSEGFEVININLLHQKEFKGQGVKIAILDSGFEGYGSRLGSELPNTVITQSFSPDGINGGGETHGTGVAEIIYDIAPEASLYLINFDTCINFSQAVDYAISQDVDIISMSINWLVGPFNGTGFFNEIVDDAIASGIIWVNSAGNYAQSHWEGNFYDPDGNKIHNFSNEDEMISITLNSINDIGIYLSWDDWPQSNQDYDLYLYNSAGELLGYSDTIQDGTQDPFEGLIGTLYPGTYYLKIIKYNATRDVNFELYSAYQELEYQVNASSLGIPANVEEAIVVGAIYRDNDELEYFSSQGPTNDGRIKPDLVAPDGVSTSVPDLLPFYGTSASTPHVAGAAALLLQVDSSLSPGQLKQAFEDGCEDLGETGKDNQYGAGRINVYASYLQIDTPPSVLIIDDDNSPYSYDDQSVDVFNSTFAQLGYNVKIEESGETSNFTWDNYDIIIWSCGDDKSPVYNPEYKEMLVDYVTNGGHLIIESGYIASWIKINGGQIIDSEFRNKVLHATADWVYCDVGDLTLSTLHTIATTPNDLPDTINFTSTNPGDNSGDVDAVRILPDATGIYNWSYVKYEGDIEDLPGAFGLIVYDDDTDENNGGQIIYYPFDIDDIDDPDIQHKLIENSQHWLKINDDWRNEWIGENSEGGSAVTTVELQNAIHHWIENIPVRGHVMSTADIQEIIVIWLSE